MTGILLHSFNWDVCHVFVLLFWLVSPLGVDSQILNILNTVDIRSTHNQELIMRIKSGIHNPERTYYTDLNGFQVSTLFFSFQSICFPFFLW